MDTVCSRRRTIELRLVRDRGRLVKKPGFPRSSSQGRVLGTRDVGSRVGSSQAPTWSSTQAVSAAAPSMWMSCAAPRSSTRRCRVTVLVSRIGSVSPDSVSSGGGETAGSPQAAVLAEPVAFTAAVVAAARCGPAPDVLAVHAEGDGLPRTGSGSGGQRSRGYVRQEPGGPKSSSLPMLSAMSIISAASPTKGVWSQRPL